MAYDSSTDLKQDLRIVPDALPSRHAPVILFEAFYKGSATFTAYYPLNEQAYRIALPKISLVRFNMTNIYNNRKRVFQCGVEWREGVGYLYATMDFPQMPEDVLSAYKELYLYMDALASSLNLHLAPVKINWFRSQAHK